MALPIHVVDAFATAPFTGNPAAVVRLERPLHEAQMRAIAAEMKHSETAFLEPRADGTFGLRWFTPEIEVDLCGHATLAAAHVIWETGDAAELLRFATRSGVLTARRRSDGTIALDFPASSLEAIDPPPGLCDALGIGARPVLRTPFDYLIELADAAAVRAVAPDFRALRAFAIRGVMVTARGEDEDFVSRFFAPGAGVDEDPATGSAHCALAPFWAARLGKTALRARQLSARGGELTVTVAGDRVELGGRAFTILRGAIVI